MKIIILLFSVLIAATATGAESRIQLASNPDLSPDGKFVLFERFGDLWRVPIKGGRAIRLTTHDATESQGKYSPDGKTIAFISNRTGSNQVFTMSANGGAAKRLTYHSEGYALHDWFPDGEQLLVSGNRDHFWRNSTRFFSISATQRSAEKLLFNGYGNEGRISPDSKQLLFTREGERWWRKGYKGSRSAQLWLYDFAADTFQKIVDTPAGDRESAWLPDGSGFLFCSSDQAKNGARNLWQMNLKTGDATQLTQFKDDLVTTPTVSADGKTIVFGHLFDLYRFSPDTAQPPTKINIRLKTDDVLDDELRRSLTSASDAAFTSDALEVALIAGGDLWVMETELKEPVQITNSAEFESDPIFLPDQSAIIYVGWKDGQADLWKVERADESLYWWQTSNFKFTQLTNDADLESNLRLAPDGQHLAFERGRGDLWIHDLKSNAQRKLVDAFSSVSYDFSPDSQWIVYSQTDDNFNNDIWIKHTSEDKPAVNISRHPDDEYSPRWSTDGKMIAFSGRRSDDEVDIYYVYLNESDFDTGSRDRSLKKTIENFQKTRKTKAPSKKSQDDKKEDTDPKKTETTAAKVTIDFEGIHRRLRRLSIADSREQVMGWSPDGKKLIFFGTVRGERGTYSVTFPDQLTPKKITSASGRIKGWAKSPDRMLWLTNGIPGIQPLSGSGKTYSFTARQKLSQSARFRAGFETAWRVMRDAWYDENYGNHNWSKIRRKYVDAAANAGDVAGLSRVMSLMLGELNGSHLGFSPRRNRPTVSASDWSPSTAHLGVRFDDTFAGPGLKVADLIPNGPAEDEDSRLFPGDIILSIDNHTVDIDMDLTTVLNGLSNRTIHLVVQSGDQAGEKRTVMLRPTSFGRARAALYQKWQDDNRSMIQEVAPSIGYLHIQGMNWTSFLEFERELYDVGYGKDGLIIDVRENGGGSTTDHLLTALTQPQHAITVPRGGGKGYPQSRMVYATWNKPIVVMCNQNSYSNAEIFSHAIKNLQRGKLVGVQTAGGVISTGSATVMDIGSVRLPFRGWYVRKTGEDMELNGALPDVVVWPLPTEIPAGKDRQLTEAIKVLQESIKQWKAEPLPSLKKATERQ